MPPKSRPSSSHSSRPASHSSPSHSSSSHSSSSHSGWGGGPSHHSGWGGGSSHHSGWGGGPSHHSGWGAPPPPPHHGWGPPPPRPRRRYGSSFHSTDYNTYGSGFGPRYSCGGCFKSIAGLLLVVVIIGIVFWAVNRREQNQPNDPPMQQHQQIETHDPIYVAALEREVSWSTQYDCYYDSPTDSYFFLNTNMEPPIWQYWFETVSSDYGDYGWLEWDAKEQKWYVQVSAKKWELLPADKYSNYLWHFD